MLYSCDITQTLAHTPPWRTRISCEAVRPVTPDRVQCVYRTIVLTCDARSPDERRGRLWNFSFRIHFIVFAGTAAGDSEFYVFKTATSILDCQKIIFVLLSYELDGFPYVL